jgi:hypothetical protein
MRRKLMQNFRSASKGTYQLSDSLRQVMLADALREEGSFLAPAPVLPEQCFTSSQATSRASGEAALMRAVLDDAISCYDKQFVSHRVKVRQLAQEAQAWLFSNDECWPFSFVNICSALGFDPAYIRQELKRRRHLPSARLGRKRRRVVSARHHSLFLVA